MQIKQGKLENMLLEIEVSIHIYWVGNKVISFFFIIFQASLLIQIININQLCINSLVPWEQLKIKNTFEHQTLSITFF